ncbi:MAG: heat-inducible transcriptional repressor HrcA, partial [Solirubrobacteraceae bacterium]
MLTERQELVLRMVVEGYLEGGTPVGSKVLSAEVQWGPSTIRHELASLEEAGLLAHPHTSAGRVPTEAGYRYFVDRLLPTEYTDPPLSLSLVRRELDEAMRVTTETLSQVTNLMAIVTAPPVDTATVKHIEVLLLQPQVLMVVIITSTGGVSKRIFTFDRPVDTGIADWAASYLNERLVGMGLGARMLHSRLADPTLSGSERAFLDS